MKKIFVIIIELLLLFVFALLMYFCVKYWIAINTYISHNLNTDKNYIQLYYETLITAIFTTLSVIANITAMVLVALKDSVFKPILDKLEAKKQARNEAKALKAEEAKQAKIAELQAQLEELKKD